MRTIIPIVLLLFTSVQVQAQQRRNFFLGVGYKVNQFDKTSTNVHQFSIRPGVEMRSGWLLSVNFSLARNHTVSSHKYINVWSDNVRSSFTFEHRIAKSSSCLSVVPSITLGGNFYNGECTYYSNKGRIADADMKSHPEIDFDKLRFFSSLQLSMDIEAGRLNFRAGPSYNFYEMRKEVKDQDRIRSGIMRGFGLECSVFVSLEDRNALKNIYIPSKGRM